MSIVWKRDNWGAKIQYFDIKEPTTIHVFCSEKSKGKWISNQKKIKYVILSLNFFWKVEIVIFLK
jgi:hypothetical protein